MQNNTMLPLWGKGALLMAPVAVVAVVMGGAAWHARQQSIHQQQQLAPATHIQQADYQKGSYPSFKHLNTIPMIPMRDAQQAQDASNHSLAQGVTKKNKNASAASEEQPEITEEAIKQAITQAKHARTQQRTEKPSQVQQGDDALSHLDMSKLSPSLQSRVEAALKGEHNARKQGESRDAMDIRQHITEFSGQLPPLNFQSHVYTTDVVRRWIKVNGVEYRQGDNIGSNIQLLDIKPQSTVIKFKGKLIEIPALYDWKG